jgi:hypothetical protein
MSETYEERQARFAKEIQSLKQAYKDLVPNIQFTDSDLDPKMIYYFATVSKGKVVISKETRSLYKTDKPENVIKGKYFNKLDAENAIKEVLPKAQEHFRVCRDALHELQAKLNFYVSYTMEGDTYGIHDEYQYIAFQMDGFRFEFKMEN